MHVIFYLVLSWVRYFVRAHVCVYICMCVYMCVVKIIHTLGNMIKESFENKSALFIHFSFHSKKV